MFDNLDTDEKEADGISAVKALALANQQGQVTYTITKDNYRDILPKLNHGDDVMTDIRNAVNAGKEVTVHQSQINFKGWKGTGYLLIDPKTGAGGYMIGGGVDGGVTFLASGAVGANGIGYNSNMNFFILGLGLGIPAGIGLGLLLTGVGAGIFLLIAAFATYFFFYKSLINNGRQQAANCLKMGAKIGAPIGLGVGTNSPNAVLAMIVFSGFSSFDNFTSIRECM